MKVQRSPTNYFVSTFQFYTVSLEAIVLDIPTSILRSSLQRTSHFHGLQHTYIEYKLEDPVLFYSYKRKYTTILLIGSNSTLLTGRSLPYHSFNTSISFYSLFLLFLSFNSLRAILFNRAKIHEFYNLLITRSTKIFPATLPHKCNQLRPQKSHIIIIQSTIERVSF